MVSPRQGKKATSPNAEEKTIVDFLRRKGVPYSEPRLIEVLFKIKEVDEEIPLTTKELERLRKIKEILRRLVTEKRIFSATFEDAETREQVPHYSVKGWFVTP